MFPYGAPSFGAPASPPSLPASLPPAAAAAPSVSAPVSTEGAPHASDASQKAAEEPAGIVVRAPIVGTFYRSPAPDSASFVEVGDRVKVGDTLCIIEAMKLMNEIEAEVSGVVTEVMLENGRPVEFDQPLFLISPS